MTWFGLYFIHYRLTLATGCLHGGRHDAKVSSKGVKRQQVSVVKDKEDCYMPSNRKSHCPRLPQKVHLPLISVSLPFIPSDGFNPMLCLEAEADGLKRKSASRRSLYQQIFQVPATGKCIMFMRSGLP